MPNSDIGPLLTSSTAVVVAVLGGLLTLLSRRTREATSMHDAWDRMDRLQTDLDRLRIAQRISEEGFDALYGWHVRARREWGVEEAPPAFSPDEDKAIRRARRAVEISDTAPVPVLEGGSHG